MSNGIIQRIVKRLACRPQLTHSRWLVPSDFGPALDAGVPVSISAVSLTSVERGVSGLDGGTIFDGPGTCTTEMKCSCIMTNAKKVSSRTTNTYNQDYIPA